MDTEDKILAKLDDHDRRLSKVEKDTAITNVEFVSVKGDLKDIKDSLSWVTRLIIGALILALITFLVSGGLNVK